MARSDQTDRDQGFDALVRATAPALHRTALLLTAGDHHLAEDLLQTTYTKVLLRWRRVSNADNPVAYTRTMLTRTFLSHRRLRRSSERPVAEAPDVGGRDQAHDERLDMLAALGRLGPRDRLVLVHRYWLDRSVADVASDLDLSEAAVRTRSKRALARLRHHLDLDQETR